MEDNAATREPTRWEKLLERIDPEIRRSHVEAQAEQYSRGFMQKLDELELVKGSRRAIEELYPEGRLDELPEGAAAQIANDLAGLQYRIDTLTIALEVAEPELDRLLKDIEALKNVGTHAAPSTPQPINRASRRASGR